MPAEDAFGLRGAGSGGEGAVKIAVPLLPNIANFDDLDPLKAEPGVSVVFVPPGTPLPGDARLIILPGSKATIADLMAFRAEGWHIDLTAHARRGGRVLGVCGGYQMLGRSISDPLGVEGPAGETRGLGLLDVATVLGARKKLGLTSGASVADGAPFEGYEMHMGETSGPDRARPVLRLGDGRFDGAVSRDGLVSGVYVHGLFANDAQRAAWLRGLGAEPSTLRYEARIEETLDALAAHCAAHVDLDGLLELAR